MKLASKFMLWRKASSASLSSGSSARTSSSSSTSSSMKNSPERHKVFGGSFRKGKWGRSRSGSLQRTLSGARVASGRIPIDDYDELACAFSLIDVNGDGKISAAELGAVLRSMGDDPSDEELQQMVEAVDDDGDGYIDLNEFINLNRAAAGGDGQTLRSEELRAAFGVFDIDHNDFISADELLKVLTELGEKSVTMEECCRMIQGVDSDGDGLVNFDEFEKMMSSNSLQA